MFASWVGSDFVAVYIYIPIEFNVNLEQIIPVYVSVIAYHGDTRRVLIVLT